MPDSSSAAPRSRPFSVDTAFWRRLAYAGARYGPEFWVRYSPPVFGVAFALALPSTRRIVRDNLRAVRGQRAALREQLDVLRVFASYASCLAEGLAIGRRLPGAGQPAIVGREHLERVRSAGKGAILVTAHAGPWDAAAGLLADGADPETGVMVVMLAERDASARALHDRVRTGNGVRVLHVGAHPLDALPLVRHLRKGGLAAAQLDRVSPGQRSLSVSLFGRPMSLPAGLFALAARAEVPILPVFARRMGYFEYELSISPPIELSRRPSSAELEAAAESAATELQRFISAHPTQWFQFEPLT